MNLDKLFAIHPTFLEADAIRALCKPLELLGINYFAHVHIDSDRTLTALSNYPEFSKHYVTKNYQQFDLHMITPPLGEHFILWDNLVRKKETLTMHQDFQAFGKAHTFTIVHQSREGTDCFHFATDTHNEAINQYYLQMIEPLRQFISYFKDKVSRSKTLKKAYQIPIPCAFEAGDYHVEGSIFFKPSDHFNEQILHKRFFLNGNEAYITYHEYQCLFWLSQGKTYEEIAMILAVSSRTVKAHILKVKEKFGCRSLFQLGLLFTQFPKVRME